MRVSNVRWLAIVSLGCAATAVRTAGAQGAPPPGFPPELDAYLEAARRAWDVPGMAVAVVRNDTVLVAKGYGVRALGRPERVDGHTVFNVASLAKSFTAAAAATVVDEGKLAWDDPVRRHLPRVEFPDPYLTREVTLRDLLTHRVGLFGANMMWVPTGIDRREIVRRVRFLPAQAPFRTASVYSNVLYTVAGEVAAAAGGTTWEDLVRARLLAPLGMDSSAVRLVDVAGRANVASPHVVLDGAQRPAPQVDYTSIAPAGGVYSTANDMARWLRFQLGDGAWGGRRVLSAAAMAEAHAPQVVIPTTPAFRASRLLEHSAAYGLGWNVWDYRGRRMVWHSGNADGMPVYMALLPNERLGVLVMINTWAAPVLHGALASRILDAYLGVPTRDFSGELLARRADEGRRAAAYWRARDSARVRGTSPSLPLAAYAGAYADSLYGVTRVALEDGRLTLRMGDGAVADLAHWHHDTFDVRWRHPVFASVYRTLVTFSLDAGGRVERLGMQLNRDRVQGGRVP